jgi:hypothetical protein
VTNEFRAQLTASERLPLVLAAMGRDDARELALLRRTCPEPDLVEIQGRLSAVQQAILAFALLWLDAARSFSATNALVHARGVAERSFTLGVSAQASSTGSESKDALDLAQSRLADDPVLGILFRTDPSHESELIVRRRADLRSAFVGFVAFCASVDLDPTLVLSTNPALAAEVVAASDILSDDGLPVTGFADDVECQLGRAWRRGRATRRGSEPEVDGSAGRPS